MQKEEKYCFRIYVQVYIHGNIALITITSFPIKTCAPLFYVPLIFAHLKDPMTRDL